jgi:hypothetical protein
MTSGINYRDVYFEFPELTKLQGEPNANSLLTLRNELKANAKSVYSNLSYGNHGHLALVISAAQYTLLTAIPFVRPVFPGPLVIPAGTTASMSAVLREEHQEEVRIFREVQGVEAALIKQIVQAVDSPYLSALRDRNSNSLTGTIYQILDHLRNVYGRVSPQMVEDKDQELRTMAYNTQDPIDIVFNAVEDHAEYAEMGLQTLTQEQTIAKAYVILNKTRRFKQPITDWNRRPAVERTWLNFKADFRRAHQEFRETTDTTLESSELERNNAHLVQQVVNGMQQAMATELATHEPTQTAPNDTQTQLQAQLLQMQQSMNQLQAQVANQAPVPNTQEQAQLASLNYHARSIDPSLLQASNQLYHHPGIYQGNYLVQGQHGPGYQGQQGPEYQGRGYQGRGYQGRGYQGRGYQGRGYQGRGYQGRGNSTGRGYQGRGQGRGGTRHRNHHLYCWTHGGCAHPSTACVEKIPGHQDLATFENKMGGSTNHCPQ